MSSTAIGSLADDGRVSAILSGLLLLSESVVSDMSVVVLAGFNSRSVMVMMISADCVIVSDIQLCKDFREIKG